MIVIQPGQFNLDEDKPFDPKVNKPSPEFACLDPTESLGAGIGRPRSSSVTVGTVLYLAEQAGANFDRWKRQVQSQVQTAAAPTPWNAAQLKVSFSNIPHRRWLYGTYLVRGEITVVAAPGGAGKTALATGMAVEIATGKELLKEKIFCAHDLKVLFINAEDGGTEIQRRIWAFCMAHGVAEHDLDRLCVAGADDARVQHLSLLKTDKNATQLDPKGFEVLASALETLRPDLLILDPLVAFCAGGNMNNNAVMSLVMRELKRLATKFDCAVLVVHHTRKGGDIGNADAISGAAATVNLARRAIMPVPMTDDEAKLFAVLPSERPRYFKLVDAKSNLAPRSTNSPWYKLHSIELHNPEPPVYLFGDNVQAVTRENLSVSSAAPTADEMKIRQAILDTVNRGKIIDGQRYPYSPTLTGAKNDRKLLEDAIAAVAEATAPRQWDSSDLEAVVTRAIKDMQNKGILVTKAVEELTTKPGRFRNGRGLAVDAERAGGIPLMITQDMKTRLSDRGYSTDQIANLTPKAAPEILITPSPEAPNAGT